MKKIILIICYVICFGCNSTYKEKENSVVEKPSGIPEKDMSEFKKLANEYLNDDFDQIRNKSDKFVDSMQKFLQFKFPSLKNDCKELLNPSSKTELLLLESCIKISNAKIFSKIMELKFLNMEIEGDLISYKLRKDLNHDQLFSHYLFSLSAVDENHGLIKGIILSRTLSFNKVYGDTIEFLKFQMDYLRARQLELSDRGSQLISEYRTSLFKMPTPPFPL